MTSGLQVVDLRTTVPGGFTGSISSRSWFGTDRLPPVKYPSPPLITVTRYYKRTYYKRGLSRLFWTWVPYTVSFRKKRPATSKPPKRALDVAHPYTVRDYRLEDELAVYLSDGTTYVRPIMATAGVTDWNAVDLIGPNDQIKLLSKLSEKMAGSDFNMSVFLGEGHQTLRLIGDTAIRVAKSLHHLRKGDLAGTARSLLEGTSRKPLRPYTDMRPFRASTKQMSQKWLELQYGWKPLLQDVEGAAQFLAHHFSVPFAQTYRMSVEKRDVQTRVFQYDAVGAFTGTAVRKHRRSMIVTVSEPPSLVAELGLLDPELVAWELMPFSFVVDWFLPIGPYLQARAALSHVSVSRVVTSDKLTALSSVAGFSSKWRDLRFTRSVASAMPKVPLPSVKPLSKALSFQHCLNGLALLAAAGVNNPIRVGKGYV